MRITYFELINEVKAEYIKLRREGVSRKESAQMLQERYHNELTFGAEDDAVLFWIGLADAQFSLKELSLEVADKGREALAQLVSCVPEISQMDIKKRNEHYACAPMLERKNVPSPERFRCQWKNGDVFAYRMRGSDAEKFGVANEYIILRKVDELEQGDGRLLPVVTIMHWPDTILPRTEDELTQIPLLKLSSGRMLSDKSTYEYRLEIMLTNHKQIKQLNMQYLGNFPNIPTPEDEFYCRVPGKVLMVLPKEFDSQLSYYCSLKTYFGTRD